jgi:hypothetical protein
MNDAGAQATPQLRALSAALEPVVGAVYFAPEAHQAYEALGHAPSPGVMTDEWGSRHWGPVMMTDMYTYFCSRGAMLGQVPGEVIAAAFGVFKPSVVVAAASTGYEIADAATMWAARDRGGIAHLIRILGERPDDIDRAIELLARAGEGLTVPGRPLYAGLLAKGLPDEPVGRMWRLAERLREFRGDAHVAAWTHFGLGGAEIQVLTERIAGLPPRTYSVTRGWSPEDLDETEARLGERGLLADGRPTEAGRELREEIERLTDRPCFVMTDSLGDDAPELIGILTTWGTEIRAANGYYPSSPQEAIMGEETQLWMEDQRLPRFTGVGHTGVA